MIAIEELEKLMVELNEHGYRSDLMIEPLKKRLTLRCNLKDEDIATLARRILPEGKSEGSSRRRGARPF